MIESIVRSQIRDDLSWKPSGAVSLWRWGVTEELLLSMRIYRHDQDDLHDGHV